MRESAGSWEVRAGGGRALRGPICRIQMSKEALRALQLQGEKGTFTLHSHGQERMEF